MIADLMLFLAHSGVLACFSKWQNVLKEETKYCIRNRFLHMQSCVFHRTGKLSIL